MALITSEKKWLEKSLKDEFIRFYHFDDLKDSCVIDRGGSGVVFKAKVATSGIIVAYKLILHSAEGEFLKDFVNEVIMHEGTAVRSVKLWFLHVVRFVIHILAQDPS